jgi:hypothetical protein
MNLPTELYLAQCARWPANGRHILAHYDAETIVVYQAYRQDIGAFALANGFLGGDFSYGRMSWIKPNFLWMMFRSGWGSKENQELTLGLRLRRTAFDRILSQAVASSFAQSGAADENAWKATVATSGVRLQWDPDHDPAGAPLARRAIQLGLRGVALADFGKRDLLEVIDMTAFVAAQRMNSSGPRVDHLRMPVERVYYPTDPAIARHLKLDIDRPP